MDENYKKTVDDMVAFFRTNPYFDVYEVYVQYWDFIGDPAILIPMAEAEGVTYEGVDPDEEYILRFSRGTVRVVSNDEREDDYDPLVDWNPE